MISLIKLGTCNFSEGFQTDQLIFHVFLPFILFICEYFCCFWERHLGMIRIMVSRIMVHLCKETDEFTLDNDLLVFFDTP